MAETPSALSSVLIEAPGAMRERPVSFVEDWIELPSGLMVPPGAIPAEPVYPLGVDLFCGAGGFSCGFHQAGWHVVAATDFDEWCCLTYLANLGSPETRIIC